ncbi:MAG: hypothetical protein ACFFDT_35665, partial [Candidatus Hodarchaeota archaeon]
MNGMQPDKIVFGNLPLLGITYQGANKDETCRIKFSNRDEMKRLIEVALRYQIHYFAASSYNFNALAPTYLKMVNEVAEEKERAVQLIPCLGIPLEFKRKKVDDYKRWATYLDYELRTFGNVKAKYFGDPILNCRYAWKENLSRSKPYNLK